MLVKETKNLYKVETITPNRKEIMEILLNYLAIPYQNQSESTLFSIKKKDVDKYIKKITFMFPKDSEELMLERNYNEIIKRDSSEWGIVDIIFLFYYLFWYD